MDGNTNEKVDVTLADMNLLDVKYEIISKTTPNKTYALYNHFTGKTKLYTKGLLLRLPGLHTLYTIGAGTYDVKVMNHEKANGRYSLNAGLGDDIELSMKIRFKVIKNSKSASSIIREQDNWKGAVKKVSEDILKKIIEVKSEEIEQKCKESQYGKIRLPNIKVSEFIKNINNPELDDLGRTIALESLSLKDNFGIDLLEVRFVDIDLSEKLKNAKTQQEIELTNSKNQLLIAKNKGLAKALEKVEIIKLLKKEGYTISEITQLIELLSLPENANIIYGAKENIALPIMTNSQGKSK